MDVFAEAEGLKRRRALLERMQQQAANPTIQGPRKYAIAQLLASLATQHQTKQNLQGVDSAEAANRQQYGSELGTEMERYIGRQEGDPGAPMLPGAPAVSEVAPGMPGLPAMPAISAINPAAPQPRRAVFDAIASRFPEMQAVGKAGMAEMLRKKEPKPIKWEVDGPTGQIYHIDENGQKVVRPGFERKPQQPLVNITPFDKAEDRAAYDQHQQILPGGKLYDKAEASQKLIGAAREAVGAYSRGASSGTFEPFFQGVRGFVSRFTGADPKTIETAALGSNLAKIAISAAGGSLGAQISNTDRDFVAQAEGSINMTPEAVKRMLAISTALAIKSQLQYQRALKQVTDRGGAFAAAADFAVPMDHTLPEDPEFVKMVGNVLDGKDSMTGLAAGGAPARPAAPNAPPKSSDPRIRFRPAGG